MAPKHEWNTDNRVVSNGTGLGPVGSKVTVPEGLSRSDWKGNWPVDLHSLGFPTSWSMPVEQAVVLCGGKGSRLGALVERLPKPMVPVGGRPVIDHIVGALASAGVRRFILAAGHLGGIIAEYYATPRHPGCSIEVVIETSALGTAGSLRLCADRLDEDFLVAYGDVFIDFDARPLIAEHERHRPLGTLLVRTSDHPWDSDLLVPDDSGRVVEFVHRRDPGRLYRNIANAGLYVLSRRVVSLVPHDRPADFGADVFPAALARGEMLRIHPLQEAGFVKDMGTAERLAAVEEYLVEREAVVIARDNRRPIDTVFLDRDGVLTVDAGLVDHPARLALRPGAAEAVALLNRRGIRCIVVTNQSVVARGLCSEATLALIHERLRAELAGAGGALAAIYHCPHHPETHHGEGVPELRRACLCRKPAPGMLLRARRELGLDLGRCVMVGDRASDIRAGKAAGVRTVLVGPVVARAKECRESVPDVQFDSLLAFAQQVVAHSLFLE